MDNGVLIKLVKENLPINVSLTREPYKAKLTKSYFFTHGYTGYVFHTRAVFSNGSSHEEMLFVSETKHNMFHSAMSLF